MKFVPEEGSMVRVLGRVRARHEGMTNKYAGRVFLVGYYYPVYGDTMMVQLHDGTERGDGFQLLVSEKEFDEVGVYNFLEAL